MPARSFDAVWPEGPGRGSSAFPAGEAGEACAAAALLVTRAAATETLRETAELPRAPPRARAAQPGRFAEVEDLAYLDDLTHLFNARYLDLVLDREVQRAAGGTALQPALPRPRLLQERQRHPRPPGGQQAARRGGARGEGLRARPGRGRALRRGRVRGAAARAPTRGGALKVAERIRRTVETHHFLAREGYALSVTTCIGVASYPEHGRGQGARCSTWRTGRCTGASAPAERGLRRDAGGRGGRQAQRRGLTSARGRLG